MAWDVKLKFVDYFSNAVSRTITLSDGAAPTNDASGYTSALAAAASLATAAAVISKANVYVQSVSWNYELEVLPATNECAVRNVLQCSFDLDGKEQKGKLSIPCPDVAVVLDSNRQVDLVAVRNSDFIQFILDGDAVISDGDTATWLRDANIISQRGTIESE